MLVITNNSYTTLQPGLHIPGVDIAKYIMSLGVVAIHVAAGSCTGIAFPNMFTWFIRLAVPFFFVSSGFLLAREETNKSHYERNTALKIRCGKILKLFLIWIIIYLPIAIIYYLYNQKSMVQIIESIISTILINGELPYAWPLWFLYSLLITFTGFWLTVQSKINRIIFIIFVIFTYIINQILNYTNLADSYPYIHNLVKFIPIRAISGGTFFLCGRLVYNWYNLLSNWIISLSLLIISSFLFILGLPGYELIGGISIFLIFSILKINNYSLSKTLRVQSMWIYYLHMYVIFIIVVISKYEVIQLQLWPTYLLILSIIMTLAYILSKLQKEPRFQFLSFLTK